MKRCTKTVSDYLKQLAVLFDKRANEIKNDPRMSEHEKRSEFLTLIEATRFYLCGLDRLPKRKGKHGS